MTEQEKITHILRRFGLGASANELKACEGLSPNQVLERMLAFDGVDEGFGIPITSFTNPDNGALNDAGLKAWWYLRLCVTTHPLEQKLTIFWHDHFATSINKVGRGYPMHEHIETLRNNCAGSFLNLLMAISKDPAMVFWLDNNLNVVGKPNENFAREVMELFTLGEGHYTEEDIAEAARAFTGYSLAATRNGRTIPLRNLTELPFGQVKFLFDQPMHDKGVKTILGKTGNLTGDDVLKHLVTIPQTAKYVSKKFWEFFVYPNPSAELIERIAVLWRKSDLNIKELVRIVARQPEFFSDKAHRAIVKNPIDFVIPTMRALGAGAQQVEQLRASADARLGRAGVGALLTRATTSMGMCLTEPPDVSGWLWGENWISTSTMVERVRWADSLFGARATGGVTGTMAFPVLPFIADNPTPTGLVDWLLKTFDAKLPDAKRKQAIEAVTMEYGERITLQNSGLASRAAARLIFGSPEFQFC